MARTRSATRGWLLHRLAGDRLPLLGGGLVHAGEGRSALAPVSVISSIFPRRPVSPIHAAGGRPGGSQASAARTSAAERPRSSTARSSGPRRRPRQQHAERRAPRARSSSRSSGGGGKYSSSVVTWTSSTPSVGARRGQDLLDECLGRRRPGGHARRCRSRSAGTSSAVVDPDHPGAARGARPPSPGRPCWRSWPSRSRPPRRPGAAIVPQRGLAVGGGEAQVAAPGQPQVGEPLAAAASMSPRHSSWLRVVWASRATGVSPASRSPSASRSASVSIRRTASGATAMVPTASSWPAWPT